MMNNIYLIGMMGSGKSTVGKNLSKKLNMSFVDIDDDIKAVNEMKMAEIFDNFDGCKFGSPAIYHDVGPFWCNYLNTSNLNNILGVCECG